MKVEDAFVMIGHTENSDGTSYVDYDFEAAIRMGIEHLVGVVPETICGPLSDTASRVSASPHSRAAGGR